MCAWDKSYHSLVYPKEIIGLQDMSPEERAFYDSLIEALKGKIQVEDLVVEQRNSNYRTVVYGSWDNDFLRYHFGSDGFWVSVRMSRELMKKYQDSPFFAAQENNRRFHWRASVKPDEIEQIGNIVVESAIYFLDALNGDGETKGKAASKPTKNR